MFLIWEQTMREGSSGWGDCLLTGEALGHLWHTYRGALEGGGIASQMASTFIDTGRGTVTCKYSEERTLFGAFEN